MVKAGSTVNLTLALEKTETGKYPQAKVFNTSGTLLSTVNLTEVDSTNYAGVYTGTYTAPSTAQDIYVVYRVFSDSGRTTLDTDAESHATDEIFVTPLNFATGNGAYSHTDTIINDNTDLPIEGGNVYIYTDSARTNLVASTTTQSDGTYRETLYSDISGTHYRRIVSVGNPVYEDTVTFS